VHSRLHRCLTGSLSDNAIPRSPTEAENDWRRSGGSTIQIPYDYFGVFRCGFLEAGSCTVVIPHGDFDSDFEKYLVATISFVLLCLAAWQFYRNRR
jgi:hypothetical protein